MSLTLFLCEVEESEKGWPFLASLQKSSFALNFRQVHGAQVALLQSPILRLLREKHKPAFPRAQKRVWSSPSAKNKRPYKRFYEVDFIRTRDENRKTTQKTVTPNRKCVTHVLNHLCYRCPDCAPPLPICHLPSAICNRPSMPTPSLAPANTGTGTPQSKNSPTAIQSIQPMNMSPNFATAPAATLAPARPMKADDTTTHSTNPSGPSRLTPPSTWPPWTAATSPIAIPPNASPNNSANSPSPKPASPMNHNNNSFKTVNNLENNSPRGYVAPVLRAFHELLSRFNNQCSARSPKLFSVRLP